MSKKNLLGLSVKELKLVLVADPKVPFPTILYNYLYVQGAQAFDEMTFISTARRKMLNENFSLQFPEITNRMSLFEHGPRKLSMALPDLNGTTVDALIIPRFEHFLPTWNAPNQPPKMKGTLCIQSHALDPSTGNLIPLSTSQIISQVMTGLKEAQDLPRSKTFPRNMSQIAFTGPGDPLLNFRAVSEAITFMNDSSGLDMASWRSVIQTDGVPEVIGFVTQKLKARLVINLHSADDHLRSQLVPQNKIFPLAEVMRTLRRYLKHSGWRHRELGSPRPTNSYALLDGINDTFQDIEAVVKLTRRLPAHINLIPVNLWPEKGFHPSPIDKVMGYLRELKKMGISCAIRTPPRFPQTITSSSPSKE